MAFHYPAAHQQPLSEINTTPLIDVLLVLLVMLVITIPVATHSIDVDVPSIGISTLPDPVSNRVALDKAGGLTWNGTAISDGELAALIAQTKMMTTIPELQFEPSASVAYARTAAVLKVIKQSGIRGFGFVGNDRYARFGKAD